MFTRLKMRPKLHLSGVLGRDSAKTADFAARHATRAFGSVHEIAQDPTIDFVILATPPNARRDIVHVLAAAGKPILMEKPIEREFKLPAILCASARRRAFRSRLCCSTAPERPAKP